MSHKKQISSTEKIALQKVTRHPLLRLLLPLSLLGLPFVAQADAPSSSAPGAIPTFFAPALVEAHQSYHVLLSPNRPDLAHWQIDWGDGANGTEAAPSTGSDHLYDKPGRYVVKVQAALTDGSLIPALRDCGRLVQDEKPAAMSDTVPAGTAPSPETKALLTAMATRSAVAVTPAKLGHIFDHPVDQLSVEFWLRPNDLTARQELLDAIGTTGQGLQIYLENNALHLALPGGDSFTQPLGTRIQPGTWHHVALTYDRAPTFPYANLARFYIDGILAGEDHLDRYDTGAVDLPAASIGSAADGSLALNGSIAEVALYDRWLNPAHLLDRARLLTAPDMQPVVVVPKNAETFNVDAPHITTTVDVALNPDPTADNGPALRAAIEAAQPGTRLRVVNVVTHKPGGSFYFNSLAGGQDWTALRIIKKTDFELDGGSATFIFRTSVRQLAIRQSTRVAFRNFSIDLDPDKFRVGCYARILDVDPATGTVRFQFVHGKEMTPDRNVPLKISMWRWRSYDPKTLRILGGTQMFFYTHDVFKEPMTRDPADPSIMIGHTTNAKMLDAFQKYRQGANLLMVNNADFRNTSVSLWDHCSQVTFDHVNFYATLGMVFLSSDYDHLRVTHCRLGLPPGETVADRPLASGADGYHFHGNQGYTLFEDNEITLTDDDPISIKDGIWSGLKATGPNTIHAKGFNVGDEIELYRNDLSPLNYTATVTAVNQGDVTFDKPLPAGMPPTFLAQDHHEHSFNWVLRDSYFHDFYGRFLVYTPWARMTGNLITKSYLHLGTGAASFDGGGISSHVLVDNNILVDTSADTGLWGVYSSYPVFQDITFADDSFLHAGLNLSNSGDALVTGNYFENIANKAGASLLAVSIHTSIDPQVTANVQSGIGLTAFGLTMEKTTGAQATNNSAVNFPTDMNLKLTSH